MTKTQKKQPDRGWLARADAASALDVSPQQFDRRYAPLAPSTARQTIDRRLYFHLRTIIDALVKERVADPVSEDPLLVGGDSPALERYRAARAGMAEIELTDKQGQTVRLQLIRECIRPGITAMRSCGDSLVRRWGNECGDQFNEAVAAFEHAVLHALGSETVTK
jgi:hypothetical protein